MAKNGDKKTPLAKGKKKAVNKTSSKKKKKKKSTKTSQGVRYTPTKDHRNKIETMAGLGLTHDDMAILMEMSTSTIEKHFKHELRRGTAIADLAVTKNLYKIAIGDSSQALPAAIFWKKVRSKWHEVQRIIHGFDPGVVTDFVTQMVKILKENVPDTCPHCKTNINLKGPIITAMKELSHRLVSTLPASEIVPLVPELSEQPTEKNVEKKET